jgi:hypothetical protein
MSHNTGRRSFWRLGLDVLALCALAVTLIGVQGCGGGSGGGDSSNVRVHSVAPNVGPFIGGVHVTITGRGFVAADGSANVVTIGGRDCANVVTVNDTTIECTSPIGTPGMRVDVVVRNTGGQGKLTNGFTYLALAAPRSDLSGDGIADLVVSAPSDDTVGTDAGAVFIFFGTDAVGGVPSVTSSQADVVLLGLSAGDNFGLSIRTGDLNGDKQDDLLVGADRADSATVTDAGAAYVFYGPLSGPAPIAASSANLKFWGDSGIAADRFGSFVEIGDVTGDGKLEVLVSAVGADGTGASKQDVGCVFVFKGGAQLVSQGASSAAIKIFGDQLNDQIGSSMGCGDLNADGIHDLAIGSPLFDPRIPQFLQNAGGVHVFFGGQTFTSGSIVDADAVFTGEAIEDQFGTSTVVTDINYDGTLDLVAGAPMNDANDPDTGRVYTFFGGAGFVG